MKDNLVEPQVHVPNVLTTHPTLMLDSDFIHSDNSLPESEIFYFDIEEKNCGSTTIHADISLPDLECFNFNSKPDPSELTSIVDFGIREDVLSVTNVNLPPEDILLFSLIIRDKDLQESKDPQVASILNPNEFDLWKIRIEQYFLMTDYSLWEKLARKNKLKARGTLLMALPDKHQLKFNIHKDAKTLIEAIDKRNNTDLEEQSLDDLFNSLKIYEAEVKSSSSASTSTQNIAFVSSQTTDSTTEQVSVVASVSAASAKIHVSTLPNVDTLSNAVIYSFFASQSNSPQLDNDNLKQIDADDLEEIDLKCVMVWAAMTGAFRQKKNQPTIPSWHSPLQVLLVLTMSSKNDESVPASPIYDRYHSGDRYHVVPSLYTRTFMPPKPDLVFHDAPNVNEADHTAFNVELSPTKPDKDLSHTHKPSAPIIKDWVFDSEDDSEAETVENSILATNHKTAIPKLQSHENRRNRKACFVCKSLTNLIKDYNYYDKKVAQTPARNHAQRGNHQSITAVVPKTHVTRPRPAKSVITKPHSPPRRHIICSQSPKPNNFSPKVSAAKAHMVNAVKGNWAWKPKCPILDHVSRNTSASITLKRFDYNYALGRSKHMTGNMSYLSDFENINGGYVAFGGNPKGGKIFGKGKIKTGKLSFDNVYFVKELKFNLFSISQMCDKKNSVLFTDTECIILSPEFKLPDENQVLLRVPRENNMYNVDLKNIVHSGDLTCLFAKATLDESNLWHRRPGHINFKTMNKLVKGNLVRGLPSKVFKNNHTCVACKKGKQHRASCETKHFCGMKGIKREFSVSRTPQQNRIAERKNRTLVEAARTMLENSLLPIPFWDEAVNNACYVQNRVLVTKPQNKTPYELLLSRTPSIGFIRPFGCLVTILNTLDPLGKKPESEVHVSPSSSAQTKKHDDKTKKEAKGKSHVELST
nr:ribonuclease H-like domain-containing protein [Tanacetum cinerariifolium]